MLINFLGGGGKGVNKVYLTIIPRAMRARGIIVLVKSN